MVKAIAGKAVLLYFGGPADESRRRRMLGTRQQYFALIKQLSVKISPETYQCCDKLPQLAISQSVPGNLVRFITTRFVNDTAARSQGLFASATML